MVLLLKLMQECVLWEHLVFLYNGQIFPIDELFFFFSQTLGLQLLSFINIEVNNSEKNPRLVVKTI